MSIRFIAGTFVLASVISVARAQSSTYISPAMATKTYGSAPGAKSQLLSDVNGRKTYALILSKNDEVLSALMDFAEKNHVTAAHFTAIGALHDVHVSWYDLARKAYKDIPIAGQVEALSLIGDIGIADGKPSIHCHAVVGMSDGSTKGGHLLHALVSPTLEIMITVEPAVLEKKLDDESGLTLFHPAQ